MREELKIAVAQPLVVPGDIDENIRRMEPLVAEAARRGAEVVLFSEAGITGYDWFRHGWNAAVELTSPRLEPVSQMARRYNVMIVNGYHEKDKGEVFNSALVCTPDGRRMNQRKCYIQPPEDQVAPIGRGLRTREAIFYKGFKFAILICADNGMEGIYEELSAAGFDAVLAPTAGLGHSKFAFHQAELSDPARLDAYVKASESVCFLKDAIGRAVRLNIGLACCNQAGYVEEMSFFHCGHSAVIDRTGETTALIPGRFVAEHLRPDLNVGIISKR